MKTQKLLKEISLAVELTRNKKMKYLFWQQIDKILDMIKSMAESGEKREVLAFYLKSVRGFLNYQTHWSDSRIDELLSREV